MSFAAPLSFLAVLTDSAAPSDFPDIIQSPEAPTFHGLKPLAAKRERELQEIFGDGGMLARAIDGYRSREPQTEMARAVAAAMDTHDTLIAEAGTGTGKTYAYLVPAMLWGGKTIISTGTKHLQDQIFARDIPTVRRALAVPVTVAMLKGRANYLCHYYLERAQQEGRFASRHEAAQLREIVTFAQITHSGDKGNWHRCPRTRQSGRKSRPRAITVSVRNVRVTRIASSCRRARKRSRRTSWSLIITSSLRM